MKYEMLLVAFQLSFG